jgi:hypothetical protein
MAFTHHLDVVARAQPDMGVASGVAMVTEMRVLPRLYTRRKYSGATTRGPALNVPA